MAIDARKIRLLLFDLGGVLVELADIAEMWADKKHLYRREDYWPLWLANDGIRAIDRGQMSVDDFLTGWIADWKLTTPHDELKSIYENLIVRAYPGAVELLERCQRQYPLACLSNMTASHWPKVESFGLGQFFDQSFISYQMNCCKPELEAYQYVIENSSYAPGSILFIDDNDANIQGARAAGFQALLAKTPADTSELLAELGIVTPKP